MNYQEKITKIDEKIKNKEFDSAEQDLLQIINDEQIKCIEDDRYIHYSFYNYIETLIYWRKYRPIKKILQPENNIADAYFLLGFINFETKNYGKAIQYLDKASEWNPVSPRIRFEKADTFRNMGEIERYRVEVEKTYTYIYESSFMAKYYRELGWYYSEKRIFDLANALYTRSVSFLNTDLAKNELMYIAQQENREPRFSTKEEINKLFKEYNIPLGISNEITQIIYEDSQNLLKESNIQLANYLYRTLYDITLDKRFMLYTTLKDEEFGVSIKIPETWKYLEKTAYEKYNISRNTIFLFLTSNNQNVSVTCDGKCTNEQLKEAYLLNIDNMKKQGMEIITEYSIEGQKNIKQVFVDIKKGEKISRIFQNYLVVNDYLFNISWEVPNNMEIEKLYNSVGNSFAMDVVWSLNKLDKQVKNQNIEFDNIIDEYNRNGINSNLIELLSDFSKKVIKEKDPFWNTMAKNMLETLILLNLPEVKQIDIKKLLEQCKNANKARQICRENVNKLDIAKLQSEGDFINSVKTLNNENNDKTLTSILEIIYNSLLPYNKITENEDANQVVNEDLNKIQNEKNENKLIDYSQEMEGYPTFKFYFPESLGEQSKVQNNIFELRKNNKQIIRVMVSKCTSEEKLEELASNWIEKTRTKNKQEIKSFIKENIGNQKVLSYILGAVNQQDKIYKIVYKANCWITISGTLNDNKAEIINDAIEKLEMVESKNEDVQTSKNIVVDCPACNNSFELKWNVPATEKTFYCKCPNCGMELKRGNPNYKG